MKKSSFPTAQQLRNELRNELENELGREKIKAKHSQLQQGLILKLVVGVAAVIACAAIFFSAKDGKRG